MRNFFVLIPKAVVEEEDFDLATYTEPHKYVVPVASYRPIISVPRSVKVTAGMEIDVIEAAPGPTSIKRFALEFLVPGDGNDSREAEYARKRDMILLYEGRGEFAVVPPEVSPYLGEDELAMYVPAWYGVMPVPLSWITLSPMLTGNNAYLKFAVEIQLTSTQFALRAGDFLSPYPE